MLVVTMIHLNPLAGSIDWLRWYLTGIGMIDCNVGQPKKSSHENQKHSWMEWLSQLWLSSQSGPFDAKNRAASANHRESLPAVRVFFWGLGFFIYRPFSVGAHSTVYRAGLATRVQPEAELKPTNPVLPPDGRPPSPHFPFS